MVHRTGRCCSHNDDTTRMMTSIFHLLEDFCVLLSQFLWRHRNDWEQKFLKQRYIFVCVCVYNRRKKSFVLGDIEIQRSIYKYSLLIDSPNQVIIKNECFQVRRERESRRKFSLVFFRRELCIQISDQMETLKKLSIRYRDKKLGQLDKNDLLSFHTLQSIDIWSWCWARFFSSQWHRLKL